MVVQNMVQSFLNKKNKIVFSKNLFYRYNIFFLTKSFLLQKLINILMRGGAKIKSEKIIILYLKQLKKQKLVFLKTIYSFFTFINIVKPSLELVFRRVGKNIYSVPIPVRPHRQYLRSLRWVKFLTNKKHSKNFSLTLMAEHIYVLEEKTKSILLKKKQQIYFISFENRMYLDYRWY